MTCGAALKPIVTGQYGYTPIEEYHYIEEPDQVLGELVYANYTPMDSELWKESKKRRKLEVGKFRVWGPDEDLIYESELIIGSQRSISGEVIYEAFDKLVRSLDAKRIRNEKLTLEFVHTHPNFLLSTPQFLSPSDIRAANAFARMMGSRGFKGILTFSAVTRWLSVHDFQRGSLFPKFHKPTYAVPFY